MNRLIFRSAPALGLGLHVLAMASCTSPKQSVSNPETVATLSQTTHATAASVPYPAPHAGPAPVALPDGEGKAIPHQRYLVVDQFGYTPSMDKFAVLVDPQLGWNAADSYAPPAQIEVRDWVTGASLLTTRVTPWKGGVVDKASGDRGSWASFSKLTEPGLYFLYDATNKVRSHPFEVREDVYNKVLKAAFRMFYFNRANFAKVSPFACLGDRCWEHKADHVGAGQDTEARSVTDQQNKSSARDLSGGWWDAGDTNKYVTSSNEAVHQLLTAYRERPDAFTDEFGLPESGNGLPDIVDELLVEFHWLEKMQPDDLQGGALLKVGHLDEATVPPEDNTQPRFYYPEPCSSAAVTLASEFAHGALVFRQFPQLRSYASQLKDRAELAWNFYQSHPKSDACDDGQIQAGDADRSLEWQAQTAVTAAAYLFSLTHDQLYNEYVSDQLLVTGPFKDDQWSIVNPSQGDALLYFARLKRAEAATKLQIKKRKTSQSESIELYRMRSNFDLYRAYLRPGAYVLGSNAYRATTANTNFDIVQHRWAKEPADRKSFFERAAGLLHSFHGVNPMQLTYLTNMYVLGGDASADETYHEWFRDQHPEWDNARSSKVGPAPGYVTSGPNHEYCQSYSSDHACTESPVLDQPFAKAYVDTNEGWAPQSSYDKSWELTEASIGTQAAYVRLVSKFVK